ncbi:hypothetical protein [Alteromonas sp. a30]|uniref:hypothetical protein n=1 Tax=Alteromonas sp. a30 TaxID=2730917 RepID=UPI00228233AC|nr:hypothetical protein [Alteromonas sp. a30]MCY7294898.1 hypothetical protein [Alteromonas sp. a30]
MTIGWIDTIYNNTDMSWYFKVDDKKHRGTLTSRSDSSDTFDMDKNVWYELKPKTAYLCDSCGIPWSGSGRARWLTSVSDKSSSVAIFQEEDQVYFQDNNSHAYLYLQDIPTNGDYNVILTINDNDGSSVGGISMRIVDTNDAGYEILQFVESTAADMGKSVFDKVME